MARVLRSIFRADDKLEAAEKLRHAVERYAKSAPRLADWMEGAIPEGLAALDLPEQHRRRLRTTNGLERINNEITRRTRVAGLFPNEEALLRLVTAVLSEIDEEWITGRIYINLETE